MYGSDDQEMIDLRKSTMDCQRGSKKKVATTRFSALAKDEASKVIMKIGM
jgi:hypothetical protein